MVKMNKDLVKKFEEKVCSTCKDKNCKRKPTRLMKCGILYLVVNDKK